MKNQVALKWIKELVGTPTYISVIIIAMAVLDGGILVTLACVLLAATLYNALYGKLFPGNVVNGKMMSLLLLFLVQILAWGVVFVALRK